MGRQRKASAVALAALVTDLSSDELLALLDDPAATKEFARSLVRQKEEATYVKPLSDEQAMALFVERGRYTEAVEGLIASWRKMASDLGYTGPVAWRVGAGFTLKEHAPKAGPCHDDFKYLQNWSFMQRPTRESVVFWIPRMLPGSRALNAREQCDRLFDVREEYNLPSSHLRDFGSAELLSGLILAEFRRSGDRVPFQLDRVRTDTADADDDLLCLGDFNEEGLYCFGEVWAGRRDSRIGVFPLGVERLVG